MICNAGEKYFINVVTSDVWDESDFLLTEGAIETWSESSPFLEKGHHHLVSPMVAPGKLHTVAGVTNVVDALVSQDVAALVVGLRGRLDVLLQAKIDQPSLDFNELSGELVDAALRRSLETGFSRHICPIISSPGQRFRLGFSINQGRLQNECGYPG